MCFGFFSNQGYIVYINKKNKQTTKGRQLTLVVKLPSCHLSQDLSMKHTVSGY